MMWRCHWKTQPQARSGEHASPGKLKKPPSVNSDQGNPVCVRLEPKRPERDPLWGHSRFSQASEFILQFLAEDSEQVKETRLGDRDDKPERALSRNSPWPKIPEQSRVIKQLCFCEAREIEARLSSW
jgi:hypothetical protein